MSTAEHAQRRFTLLRLRFNAALTQLDVFQNVGVTQRSENEIGVWLSGLDVVSADALKLRGEFYEAPPIICHLDRGIGAADSPGAHALPGGGDNPVAIIRVPRERMIGTGFVLSHSRGRASSGGAPAVGGIASTGAAQHGRTFASGETQSWTLWERWISEIVADFWSVARVGLASTMGLMGVVSACRVRLFPAQPGRSAPVAVDPGEARRGCLGRALHPQPMWDRLIELWESFYPPEGISAEYREIFAGLERTIPALVSILVAHRPAALKGLSLAEAMDLDEVAPTRLRDLLRRWRASPREMYQVRPLVAFAALGQGRAEAQIAPEEGRGPRKLLTHWALQSTLEAAAGCARPPKQCKCRM